MHQPDLFGDGISVALVYPEPIGPAEKPLSYGRRLTQRHAARIAAGHHPVTGARLLAADWQRTCAQCTHLFRNGPYPKCALNATRGPATDIRLRWPACSQLAERTDP